MRDCSVYCRRSGRDSNHAALGSNLGTSQVFFLTDIQTMCSEELACYLNDEELQNAINKNQN